MKIGEGQPHLGAGGGAGADPGPGPGAGAGVGFGAKVSLRRRILSARAELSAEQRAAAGSTLRDAVLGLPEAQMAGTAAVYYSIGSEPGTHGLVYALWKRGTYVLLPVLRPDMDLDWASYE